MYLFIYFNQIFVELWVVFKIYHRDNLDRKLQAEELARILDER